MPLLFACLACLQFGARASIDYTLSIDSTAIDVVQVTMRLENVPSSFRLAMKVHQEYDAKYWRYLDSLRVDGAGRITREDSTLWRVSLPGGRGTLRYRIRVQRETGPRRDSWRPFVSPTGALINPPDFFLYLPDAADAASTVTLRVPNAWHIATSLTPAGARGVYSAPDAFTLLDSPILLGNLRQWSFVERGTTFHVVYWPLPTAAPFDTAAFVDGLRRLTHETVAIFGRPPTTNYYFLFQDDAQDALEHTASVAIGLPSEELARNPHARSLEIAHELFHTWNLVAIRPDRYGELSYRPTLPTTALWWSEGVTLYYADALTRRAGIADTARSRLDRLRNNLRAYYSAWWTTRVSPERASMAFGVSPLADSNATGGYYTQGELLGHELDALVRDSTRESRSLEDVMRAMFARHTPRRGFTAAELEAVTDSVCGCRLDAVFANQVRGHAPIDVRPALTRLGLKLLVDTTQVVNDSGAPMPDLRASVDFTRESLPLRLVVNHPASAWRRAGLRTGDELISIDGVPIATFAEMRRVLGTLRIGQTVVVQIRRAGEPMRISVPVIGYSLPRVRFVDVEAVTPEQRARRERWLEGR